MSGQEGSFSQWPQDSTPRSGSSCIHVAPWARGREVVKEPPGRIRDRTVDAHGTQGSLAPRGSVPAVLREFRREEGRSLRAHVGRPGPHATTWRGRQERARRLHSRGLLRCAFQPGCGRRRPRPVPSHSTWPPLLPPPLGSQPPCQKHHAQRGSENEGV